VSVDGKRRLAAGPLTDHRPPSADHSEVRDLMWKSVAFFVP